VPVVVAAHRAPRLPRDPQDHDGDGEADERIGDLEPGGQRRGGGDDGERDVGVGAGVVAVSDQRR